MSAVRRARIDHVDIESSLHAPAALPINPERAMGISELPEIVTLATTHGLTTCDARARRLVSSIA
ncbi:MAG: hypothetical protein IPG28_11475 [Betaproteobacteria bacterium]|nr:hypothetical protein [Betaproteobacteria bacterium]